MFTPVPSWLVNVEIGIWEQWRNALCTSGSLATGTLVEFTWAAYTHLCVCVCTYMFAYSGQGYIRTVRNKSVHVASCLDNYFSWCSL